MWAVPKMMQWVNTYQGLQNAGEIKKSIMKLTSPSSMTVQDWQNVSQALQIKVNKKFQTKHLRN